MHKNSINSKHQKMYNVTKINTTKRFQESPVQFLLGLTIDTVKHEHSENMIVRILHYEIFSYQIYTCI